MAESKHVVAVILFCLLYVTKEEDKLFWKHNSSATNQNGVYKSQSICKDFLVKNCSCFYKSRNTFAVNCSGLNDIDTFLRQLKLRFGTVKIVHVFINQSTIDHLPPRAFENLYITEIKIKDSKVSNVSDDAFLGVDGLTNVQLYNFNVTAIPTSLGKLNELTEVVMDHGSLTGIKTSLQNCSSMISLSFKKNKILQVDYSAFVLLDRLLHLDLSNNTILWLDPRTFSSFGKLVELDLTGNKLRTTNGLFNKLQFSIKTLKLGGNNISDMSKVVLHPFYSLDLFILSDNPITAIEKYSLKNIPAVTTLAMKNCLVKTIHPASFQFVTNLFSLDIRYNQISYLDKNIFASTKALHYLYISGNRLENLTGLFEYTDSIRTIEANNNYINQIDPPCFKNAKFLRSLFLGRNSLTRLRKDTFVHNGYLNYLLIPHNKIKYLEMDAFRGLYQLRHLSLADNMLTSLNNSINNLLQLAVLELDGNYLTILDAASFRDAQMIKFLNLSSNRLESVEGAFSSLVNLEYLHLRNNSLKVITKQSVASIGKLKIVSLYGNPLECTCLLKWLVELVVHESIKVDDARCENPQWLENKFLGNLSTKDVIEWPENCPQQCHCSCVANYTDYYIGVFCGGLQLTTTPAVLPKKTGYLDLSNNQISSVPQSMFDNLTQLQNIFLHHNNLTSMPDFSSVKLQNLSLDTNFLTRFSVSHVNSAYLERVTLSNNSWLCDCQTLDFRKWLLANELSVSDVNFTKCADVKENGRLRNRAIISLSEFLLCSYLIAIYAAICIGVLGFLLFVAGGKITYNRYRMNIKIWMYTKGICSCLSCIKEEDLDEDKEFDAFVSYSSEDETFVVRSLVPLLENGDKPYLLCLHYRQFPPGSYIQDSIMQAVKISKRTIMVLSKNFLQSEWCRLEFKSAHHQVLEERLNRLIVIILGELPPKEEIDPEINVYLESTTYLKWGEKNFWNKLRYIMPKTPCAVTDEEKTKLLD